MQQAASEISNRSLVTDKEHRFVLLGVELCIPAGSEVNECLEDAAMFGTEAIEVLTDEATGLSTNGSSDNQHLWAALHLLKLSHAMHSAAHSRLISAGRLTAA